MKVLKNLCYNKVLSAFIVIFNLLTLVRAKVISECSAVSSQTPEFIANPNTACNSLYPYIYCNSASSTYCTREQCSEEYECTRPSIIGAPVNGSPTPPPSSTASNAATPTTTVSSSSSTQISTTTSSTPAPTSVKATSTSDLITITIVPLSSAPATTTTVNMRSTCQVGVTGNYPYPRNCRYYYRCSNGYHWLQDCGFRMSFDVIDGYCKSTKVARCLVGSSRESFW